MTETTILTGHVLAATANPFDIAPGTAFTEHEALAMADGKILDLGPTDTLRQRHPTARIEHHKDHLILPGFVDAHMHYPQTAIIASWGKRLIDWLNTYTFPEEMRFGDPAYASEIANRTLDLALAHGTTTLASYCTIHPASVDAFFTAAAQRNMAVTAGKTCMDRNAPDGLLDTAQSAYDDSKALLQKWHGRGRARYAITPRFSPTSTRDQLTALGALWAEHPDCLMQTHLSEQTDEIAWVKSLFPDARDYLDTYEQTGLLGQNALFGHAIHLQPREIDRLAETSAAIAHCPTSNTFIGSGLCDVTGLMARNIPTGLATDTGGGSSFSMLRAMAAAYEIAQLRGTALHPAQLLWLATEGAAQSLKRSGEIGRIAPGTSADLIALNLKSTPAITQRTLNANTLWEALFPTIMMGDDRAIAKIWIAGTPYK